MKSKITEGVVWAIGLILGVGSIIVGFGVVAVIVHAASNHNSQPSAVAIYNTSMHGFISGCEGQPNADQSSCTCAWNHLDTYYKSIGESTWYSDSSLTNRIITSGYNQDETNAAGSCFE